MIKKTNQFVAKSDDKQTYTIFEYTKFIDTSSKDGSGSMPSTKSYKTIQGDEVRRLEKGKYLIAVLNLVVTSDDPKAP